MLPGTGILQNLCRVMGYALDIQLQHPVMSPDVINDISWVTVSNIMSYMISHKIQ